MPANREIFSRRASGRKRNRSGFRLQSVPRIHVERLNRRRNRKVARKPATRDQFNHVGFVFVPSGRASIPTVQLERNQLRQSDDLQILKRFRWQRKGNLAAALQNFSSRETINHDTAQSILHAINTARDAIKWAAPICRQKLHSFENIWNNDVHVNGHPRISMFLHRNAAGDQMRNIVVREHRRSSARGLHYIRCPRFLPEKICLIFHGTRFASITGQFNAFTASDASPTSQLRFRRLHP